MQLLEYKGKPLMPIPMLQGKQVSASGVTLDHTVTTVLHKRVLATYPYLTLSIIDPTNGCRASAS